MADIAERCQNSIENSNGATAKHASKTHCHKGHPLSGDNLVSTQLKRGRPDATLETDSYPTKKVEQQIHEALHPVGMSVHSGKVQLDCSHVQRIIERSRLIERQRNALQAKLVEAEKDAKRHRFARTLFSSDDVTLALDSMRGFVPTEEENLKYDAAIDAALAQEEGR